MRFVSSTKLKHVLQFWTEKFTSQNIPDPHSSAEYIIAHTLGAKTLFNVRQDTVLSKSQTDEIKRLCNMRLIRMPVQYILEEWDFYGATLKMKPPVLIPRPETEELTDLCSDSLSCMPTMKGEVFLEIGPGSGAITVTLLKRFPQLQAVAVDLSEDACQLTQVNAEVTGTSDRLTVLHGDFMSAEVFQHLLKFKPFCLAVSNPPYITTAEMEKLQDEIKCFEDPRALHGGEDGLDIVRGILLGCSQLLQPTGHLWLEVGENHPPLIEKFSSDPDTWKRLSNRLIYEKTVTDLFGKPRFCQLIASPPTPRQGETA